VYSASAGRSAQAFVVETVAAKATVVVAASVEIMGRSTVVDA
jgi:hypothetical protein